MRSILFVISLLWILTSCQKSENVTSQPNGKYSGVFTVTYPNGATHSNSVTVNFSSSDKSFNCSGNRNDYYPAGGSGSYKIENSKIVFSDTNIWTANFDWNLILNGSYNYTMNGTQLIISAGKNNVGFYQYKLNLD